MAKQSRLSRIGSRYYFRAKVPVDVLEAFGKKEVKFSLRTADYKEALVRVRKASVDFDNDVTNHRRSQISVSGGPRLTDLQITEMAVEDFENMVARQREIDLAGDPIEDAALDDAKHDLKVDEDMWRDALARFDYQEVYELCDRRLLARNITLDRSGREYRLYCKLTLRSQIEYHVRLLRELNGKIVTKSFDPMFEGVGFDARTPARSGPRLG